MSASLKLKGLPLVPVLEIHHVNVRDGQFTNLCCWMLERKETNNEDKEGDGDTDSLSLMHNSTCGF